MRSASSFAISASEGTVQDVGGAVGGVLAGAGHGEAKPGARRLSVKGSLQAVLVKTPESVPPWSERSPSSTAPTPFISSITWSP